MWNIYCFFKKKKKKKKLISFFLDSFLQGWFQQVAYAICTFWFHVTFFFHICFFFVLLCFVREKNMLEFWRKFSYIHNVWYFAYTENLNFIRFTYVKCCSSFCFSSSIEKLFIYWRITILKLEDWGSPGLFEVKIQISCFWNRSEL